MNTKVRAKNLMRTTTIAVPMGNYLLTTGVGLSSRKGGAGAVEHKEGSYHGKKARAVVLPDRRWKAKRSRGSRFASRKGVRKAGGYQEPKLGA